MEKRNREMNKKPLLWLLAVLILAAGICVFLLVKGGAKPDTGGEDVRLFYYRCIPGLKRAEDQEKVLSIRKSYALNDKGSRIELDRIWIGEDMAWVLYHTDGGTSLSPSGTLVLAGAGGENVVYGPDIAETEGMTATDGVYGYFILRRIGDGNDSAIDQASLYPVVSQKRFWGDRVTELDPISLLLSVGTGTEDGQAVTLSGTPAEVGDFGILTPAKVTFGPSRTYVEMDWNADGSGYELYGIRGTLYSSKGEGLSLDSRLDDQKRVALPAFNYPDTVLTLDVETVYLTYPQPLTLTIDPKDYRKGGSRKHISQPVFQAGGPQCILDAIRLTKDWAYLDMIPAGENSGLDADPWGSGADTVACVNGAGSMAGTLSGGDAITVGIPRSLWEQDLAIWVQVGDPLISIHPGLHIDLRGE